MNLYKEILEKSVNIDWSEREVSEPLSLLFPVPKNHPRYAQMSSYPLRVTQLSKYHFGKDDLVIADEAIKNNLAKDLPSNVEYLTPTEDSLKTIKTSGEFVSGLKGRGYKKVVAIGGGIIINFATSVAEQLGIDLVLIPTTIISMSDASIGGKVRLNDIGNGQFIKHAYKSFYEPSEIILDPQFLNYLDSDWIRTGLAEVIKHAVYQSPLLARYLLSKDFHPYTNKESLLRAILWTADLKRICLEIDPGEAEDGSHKILRAAHDLSDKIEEREEFKISHGKAVEEAMVEDLYSDKSKYNTLIQIYEKLAIPYKTMF